MEQGNNIQCLKTFRLKIPLYNEQGLSEPGQKYFFPDNPIFKGKNIVGIDLNAGGNDGDLKADKDQDLGILINLGIATAIYCTIYGNDRVEKFTNAPLRSFFMMPAINPITLKANPRRVKPYYGEIYPRMSYLYYPPGVSPFTNRTYISLNFYYI
jgi:hypothetical protein